MVLHYIYTPENEQLEPKNHQIENENQLNPLPALLRKSMIVMFVRWDMDEPFPLDGFP